MASSRARALAHVKWFKLRVAELVAQGYSAEQATQQAKQDSTAKLKAKPIQTK